MLIASHESVRGFLGCIDWLGPLNGGLRSRASRCSLAPAPGLSTAIPGRILQRTMRIVQKRLKPTPLPELIIPNCLHAAANALRAGESLAVDTPTSTSCRIEDFDIAGPNPNEDERKQIDRSYMDFLGSERREMLLADLAKAQANLEQATSEHGQRDIGAPLALTPKIPLPVKRPPIEHAKVCEGGSLSCSWAKLSAAVRNAFALSAGANR